MNEYFILYLLNDLNCVIVIDRDQYLKIMFIKIAFKPI